MPFEPGLLRNIETLGLSQNEAKVYIALLEMRSASAGLVAQKSGVHRVNVYDTLERLMEKGLVSTSSKAEKKYFEVASPENLKRIAERKRKEIEQFDEIFPQLELKYQMGTEKQEVHHFKGKRGIISIYEDMIETLKPGEYMYGLGTTGIMREILKHWITDWTRRRDGKGVKVKSIYYQNARGKEIFPLQERRFLPKQFGFFPTTTYVYADKVAIISFTGMIGVVIQSKEIAVNFKRYFDQMWSISED
ncbi:TrmB family transcriptional regulator [Candidatus Woesearchaeota archaeon]|nr:TrmB family transcriptional regulator [Candidatus Woesearchaeota archaeon]